LVPYELTIKVRPTHLHAKVVGERTPENAHRFLKEVFSACVKSGHSNALLETHLSGPSLNTSDILVVFVKLCKLAVRV